MYFSFGFEEAFSTLGALFSTVRAKESSNFNIAELADSFYRTYSYGSLPREEGSDIDACYIKTPFDQIECHKPVFLETFEKIRTAKIFLDESTPELSYLLESVIRAVVLIPTSDFASQSRSSNLGKIYFGCHNNFDWYDFVELLVHELTHNLLFLDECLYGHFKVHPSQLLSPVLVKSAIRTTDRPFEASFHSAVVGAELLAGRATWQTEARGLSCQFHPKSEALRMSVIATIDSLLESDRNYPLLTERSHKIIDQAIEACGRANSSQRIAQSHR